MSHTASTLRALALPAVTLVLFALQVGCGSAGPRPMHAAEGVPASQGTVEATEAPDGNTALAIRVRHLARPGRVEPGMTVYMVWIQPRGAEAQSVGALAHNSDLEGSLDTVTPHRLFTVTVTPEANTLVAHPTNDPVFTAEVSRAN